MSSTTALETIDKGNGPTYFDCECHIYPEYPHYSRIDWDGFDLPRSPSLRMEDDAIFFQLIRNNYNGKNSRRFIDVAEESTSVRGREKVPLYIRKLEIELVQLKLPRYPSKTHLTQVSFYPLPSPSRSNHNKDYSYDRLFTSEESGRHSTEYEDGIVVEEAGSQNIEYAEQEEEIHYLETERQYQQASVSDHDVADDVDEAISCEAYSKTDRTSSSGSFYLPNDELSLSSNPSLTRIVTVEDEPYELKIGVVPTPIQAMIYQAQIEMRCRKIPNEHKIKYKPSVLEAALVGRGTKLNEHIIEEWGKNYEKYKPTTELPSATWTKGQEYFTVNSVNNFSPSPVPFQVFNEAVALGGIKALKPEITTNFDPLSATVSAQGDDVDVDDENRHKQIRTRYLTDMYVHREFREDGVDIDEMVVNYNSLDDVKLPTEQCPIFKPVKQKLTNMELKEAIAQQVAEKVWERRYRLERPRAVQRIKYQCNCKYCKTYSPYQTVAYRKKWLTEQGLWNEPKIEEKKYDTNGDDDEVNDVDTPKFFF